jgi:hypothetical protein
MRTCVAVLSLIFAAGILSTPAHPQDQTALSSGSSRAPSDSSHSAAHREDYDPLLDLPPLPNNRVTLMGGVAVSMDEVMNRMTFQPFGTKQKLQIHFDTRTHFYQDGKDTSESAVKQGQRIYLDTMLDGEKVFARTIWIRTSADSGVGEGQIIDFDPGSRIVTVRDELSNQPLRLELTPATVVRKGNQPGSEGDLVEGALVAMEFGAQTDLRGITVLATPGSVFSFLGRVTYVDLSAKLIAIDNQSDGKKYDVSMDAIAPNLLRQVHEGGRVSVSAVFDGKGYAARSIDFLPPPSAPRNP